MLRFSFFLSHFFVLFTRSRQNVCLLEKFSFFPFSFSFSFIYFSIGASLLQYNLVLEFLSFFSCSLRCMYLHELSLANLFIHS